MAFSNYNQMCGHDSDTQRVLKSLRRLEKGFIFVQAKGGVNNRFTL
jgi:hypothetical protein